MRLRTLAAGLLALAALSPAASADPLHFERECSGKVDTTCNHKICGILDCIVSDCVVFADPLPGYNSGICIGPSRPRDPSS